MRRLLTLALGIWGLVAGGPSIAEEVSPRKRAASAVMELSGNLYRQLARDTKPSENFLVSPSSAGAILAVASLGTGPDAPEEIRTLFAADELDDAFHAGLGELLAEYEGAPPEAPAYTRTGIWADAASPPPVSFEDRIRKTYRSSFAKADFRKPALLQRILNTWASQQTHGQITDAVSQIPAADMANFASVSALLLRAQWRTPFLKDDTRSESFTLISGRSSKVAMMHLGARFRYASTDTEELVELPYRETTLAFVLVVPRARDGLAALEARLTGDVIRHWEQEFARIPDPDQPLPPKKTDQAPSNMPSERPPEVALSLPRFGFYSRLNLKKVLRDAGAKQLFDSRAGLNELTLRTCDQAIRIELDEQGTRLAAVAGAVGGAGGIIPDRVAVCADHPFLFYIIRDYRSGLILAMGRVMDPASFLKSR